MSRLNREQQTELRQKVYSMSLRGYTAETIVTSLDLTSVQVDKFIKEARANELAEKLKQVHTENHIDRQLKGLIKEQENIMTMTDMRLLAE